MLEQLGLLEAGSFLWDLMYSFTFFAGILLMVSPEGVECIGRELDKEYGMRKHVFIRFEEKKYVFIDSLLLKYSKIFGAIIAASSFGLLIIHRF